MKGLATVLRYTPLDSLRFTKVAEEVREAAVSLRKNSIWKKTRERVVKITPVISLPPTTRQSTKYRKNKNTRSCSSNIQACRTFQGEKENEEERQRHLEAASQQTVILKE
ncbi:uncharacterized protein V6R79_010910 [Siganus canaliculatus]